MGHKIKMLYHKLEENELGIEVLYPINDKGQYKKGTIIGKTIYDDQPIRYRILTINGGRLDFTKEQLRRKTPRGMGTFPPKGVII